MVNNTRYTRGTTFNTNETPAVHMARKAIQPLHSGGKVTIPKRIRDDLGLEDGDDVEILVRKPDTEDMEGDD